MCTYGASLMQRIARDPAVQVQVAGIANDQVRIIMFIQVGQQCCSPVNESMRANRDWKRLQRNIHRKL